MFEPSKTNEVIIVGAGLAGLCCAVELYRNGVPFKILEGSDGVGGRVRTDEVAGFKLERGFQIFLTAYPEAKAVLDYGGLKFCPFFPGALVRAQGKFHKLADPIRRPFETLETLLSPVGTIADKIKMAQLRSKRPSGGTALAEPVTTMHHLIEFGFSQAMIDEFFRPFLSGIFLEPDLDTSSSFFKFVFQMLAEGDNVLPAGGMQAIPDQIASRLPDDAIKFGCRASKVEGRKVTLQSGEELEGAAVVIATDEPQRRRLLGEKPTEAFRSQTCLYFAADRAPVEEPILVLNGEDKDLVNNFCVPSSVSPSYAPPGKSLISASLIGNFGESDAELERQVRSQMNEWFGQQVNSWEFIRAYRIDYALPDQSPQAMLSVNKEYKSNNGTYICGDYMETGSINGAMVSGRKSAAAVIKELA